MANDMKMPWGKHKGSYISELPTDYLRWLAERCEDEDICEAADEEYRLRRDHGEE